MIALALRYWHLFAIAALVALLGVQSVRISALKSEHAEYVAESEKSARLAVEQALAEQSRRQQAVDEEAANARAEIKALETTVADLADASDGLRDAVAKYKRAGTTACPAIGGKGKPDPAPRELLADLYLGLVKAAQDTSGYAERVYIAGTTCERTAEIAR
jgi:hypothetical protein